MKFYAIGGFSEVGGNMCAVEVDNKIFIIDIGLHVENYIKLTEKNEEPSVAELRIARALPLDSIIKKKKNSVKAIIISHAHLDHIGALPYLATTYNCPVILTPYSYYVLNAMLRDKDISLTNELIVLMNNSIKIDGVEIHLEEITHSIPHTALVIIKTREGKIVYANDFKLDPNPVLGNPVNYPRIKKLTRNAKLLIMDSLYAELERKTPSENLAREMLKEVLFNTDTKGKAIIITTFSSHIARLKSIVDFGKKLRRKIVFLGRSLARYVYAAEETGIVNFSKHVEIIKYKNKIKKKLREIEKEGRDKYLIVCTGHQGEPKSVLSEIALKKIKFPLYKEDIIIFSCSVIPSPINIANRKVLEENLRKEKVRIFKDIHQSGHASREDHREMIKLVNPEHIIPAHAGMEKTIFLGKLSEEMGYKIGKTTHLLSDGDIIEI